MHEYYPKDTSDRWWKKYKEHIKWLQRGKPVYMSIDSTPLFLIVLEKYLNSDLYELNVEATRFILSKIEEAKRQTKENYVNFWQKDRNNKPIWTIEHIFPEGKNIPKDWVKMVANGNKEKAEILQEKYVHKLGNLTLTGYNQNLSNFDFRKKRDRKSGGKDIGYKNKLFLSETLARKDEWKTSDIETRTEELVGIALEVFGINGK